VSAPAARMTMNTLRIVCVSCMLASRVVAVVRGLWEGRCARPLDSRRVLVKWR
jgi:hypothetical protein